ncbi:hypothetical protein F5Y12DRAFT_473465 [Xylaria sp. FL1777]|nr:hypothetical protein F5Y12DRAFT_473465 [Xylaria sp. FL1777]
MSSTTGPSRTRSIRKPAVNDNELGPKKLAQGRNEPRNVSPSRLPMRPPTTRSTTSSTTASSSTTTTRTRAPTGSTLRQASGSSSTKVSRSAGHEAPATTKPLGRAPSVRQAPSKTTTTTTTTTTTASSNGIGRSASIVRPRSSAGLPSSSTPRERHLGHSRAKSTVTSLTAATTLRPLSHAPSRSNPSPAPSTASSASTNTHSTKSATTSSSRVQTRSQTQHARVPSQSQPRSQSSTTAANLAARRPAFNTNQQHYSPAKSLAPKPLTSTFLAPPSPSKQPVNVALTAETSRLQTELLQLSLLHREAHSVSVSWHESARSKLGTRFQELVAADEALRALEREGAEERGLEDLIRWGNASAEISSDENSGRSRKKKTKAGRGVRETDRGNRDGDRNKLPLDEKIRLLDQILNGAWALGEPGGRYQRTVRAFEDWAFQVSEIRAAHRSGNIDGLLARGGGGGREEEVAVFVSDLDASAWKRDHAGLVRMLEAWRKTLVQLGPVGGDSDDEKTSGEKGENQAPATDAKRKQPLSGLARTLRGCRTLVRDMLAELKVMEQIELDALAAEEKWMGQMEQRLGAEEEAGDSRRGGTEDVPPWKLLAL